jgi:hypothetical protein
LTLDWPCTTGSILSEGASQDGCTVRTCTLSGADGAGWERGWERVLTRWETDDNLDDAVWETPKI